MKTVKVFLFLVSILIADLSVYSQMDDSNPLTAGVRKEPPRIGILFGLGQNYQSGTGYVACDSCEFTNGVKFGYTLGLTYENSIIPEELLWGVNLLYDYMGVSSTFQEISAINYKDENSNRTYSIPGKIEHTAEYDYSYLSAMPYITWSPFYPMFLKLGAPIGINLTANVKHTGTLIDKKATLPTGEVVNLYFNETKSDLIEYENAEIKDKTSLVFGLAPAIGFDFKTSQSTFLSIYYMQRIGLNPSSDFGKDFTLNYWRIMFEFKMKF